MIIIENIDKVPDSCLTCPFPHYDGYIACGDVCPLLNNLCVEEYWVNRSKPSSCPLKEVK